MVICFYSLWSHKEKLSFKSFEEQIDFLKTNFHETYPARDFAETAEEFNSSSLDGREGERFNTHMVSETGPLTSKRFV